MSNSVATPAVTAALSDSDRWKAALDMVRAKRARLAISLAFGRVLKMEPGLVLIGFTPEESFHRAQVQKARADVEGLLTTFFGTPTGLRIEQAAPATTVKSPAEEMATALKNREEATKKKVREHPAVASAVRLLGGNVEDVQLSEPEQGLPTEDAVEESP